MARFLLVNQFYWPDFASTGQHLTDLAEHLVRHGHEVRVLCSRGRYLEGGLEAPRKEEHSGVRIHRVRASAFGRRFTAGRMSDYLSFHAMAGPRVALTRWADVVVTLTTPPLLGLWGAFAKKLRGARHVVFLMDHHPDAEFEMGLIQRTSSLGRTLEDVYGWVLRSADHVGVLGRHMAKRVRQRGVPPERLSVVPIWSRADEIVPVKHKDNNLRRSLGWDGRFVVLYSGNAGFVHRFEELCGAMRRLAIEDPDVLFAFVGGGPRRAEIESFAKEWRLQNASFLPYFPRESLGLSLPAADAHFLSLRREHVGVSVPGKLYGQLASGRPVLFVGPTRCETAEDVSASGAGIVVGHGDANGLADAILRLKRNPDLVARMGAAGREWFLLNRERVASCEMWRRLLEDVAAGRPVERKRRPARGASSPKRAATRAA